VKAWVGRETQKGCRDEPPFPFRRAVKAENRPCVFIFRDFSEDLYDLQLIESRRTLWYMKNN
jgi:hypothetical protein